ncbi:MAG TPA: glycosyltransferase family 39 protein, partial [Thermoanaerobaculia bacterium]|nr:glycosyltransferase family 39 protein [Thermoanaerobaculia bacterium]
ASGPEKAYEREDFLNDSKRMFAVARIPVLLLGLAGGLFVFLWSRQLWGAWGAAISTLLYAFDPSLLAHSSVVTTDVAIATCTVATLYFFWRTSQRLTAGNAAGFVIAFSLAQTAKFTAVLLVPVVIALALWHLVRHRRTGGRMLGLIAVAGVASIVVLWGAYGFRFAAAADGSGGFFTANVVREWQAKEDIRRLGPDAAEEQQLWARRSATAGGAKSLILVAKRYRLLPEAYLHGVAFAGASTVLRTAFLNGEFSSFGFATYFFWTFLYKTPLPAIVAIAAGLFFALRRRPAGIEFLLVPAAILLAVAVLSRFNIGHRHILVVMPLLYILAGSLGALWDRRRAVWIPVAGAVLALSSSIVFAGRPALMPGNHMAYLNEIAGGPRRGYVRINDSNFDWGQDLARLGRWVREHGVAEPIQLAYFGTADARVYGIRFRPASPVAPLRPGYLAISTVEYIGLYAPPAERDRWPRALERANAQLFDSAGYSILIFKLPDRGPSSQ